MTSPEIYIAISLFIAEIVCVCRLHFCPNSLLLLSMYHFACVCVCSFFVGREYSDDDNKTKSTCAKHGGE